MTQTPAIFLRRWWATCFVLTAILALSALPESTANGLSLQHEPIAQGQWWRLFTCHLVHLSFNHTLLNFAGYLIVALSFRDEIGPKRELLILLIAATAVGVGIYTFNKEMYSYVGLSGAIYGVLVAYVIIGFNKTPLISAGFLGFIILKFIYEAIIGGANSQTEAFIGGKVATDSHLYGALSGLIPGVYFYWRDKKRILKTDTLRFVAQFKNGIVRDLAWALHSPPLLDYQNDDVSSVTKDQCIDFAYDFLPKLKQLDSNPEPLLNEIDADKLRLGLYFEALIGYWLRNQSRFKLLAHGLTVSDDGRTLGEFDFIIHDNQTQQTLHWETAVKFYLGINQYHKSELWYGPGKKDRLDKKLAHLINKQVQLSNLPQAKELLTSQQLSIHKKQLFVKGRLFYPPTAKKPASDSINSLHINHLKSRWYTQSELTTFRSVTPLGLYPWQTPLFHLTDKHEWLTNKVSGSLSFKDLQDLLRREQLDWPVIVIGEINNIEKLRFFIVPDDWGDDLPSS